MAPTRTTARLLEAAERAGAKVIAIGDPGQLASVQAGGWLRAVGARVGALRLTRGDAPTRPRRAARARGAARPRSRARTWTGRSRPGGSTRLTDGAGRRVDAVAEWAAAASEVGCRAGGDDRPRQRHPPTRSTTPPAQLRRDLGRARRRAPATAPIDLAVGDRVICRRNDALLDVDNGTRGTVRHLGDDRVVIETDSHLVRTLPAAVCRRARRARLRADRSRHAGRHRRARDRRRHAARSHGGLELHRALARPRHHAPADPRRRRSTATAPTSRRASARAQAREELLARRQRRMLESRRRGPRDRATPPRRPRRRPRAHRRRSWRAGPGAGGQARRTRRRGPGHLRLVALRERIQLLRRHARRAPADQLGGSTRSTLGCSTSLSATGHAPSSSPACRSPARSWRGRLKDPDLADRVRLRSILGGVDETTRAPQHASGRSWRASSATPSRSAASSTASTERSRLSRREYRALRDELTDRELANPAPWVRADVRRAPRRLARRDLGQRGPRPRRLPPRPRHHRPRQRARPRAARIRAAPGVAARARSIVRSLERARPRPRRGVELDFGVR